MQSHPSRGAWIEIAMRALDELEVESRTPRGVRGLKYPLSLLLMILNLSHPSRGAWIEIRLSLRLASSTSVAPLAGCVD